MDAPGGGETQMLGLAGALQETDIDARLWRPWEDRLAQSDCLHLFGSVPEHLSVVEVARRHNVPVVLSTITWFDLASYWRQPRSLPGRFRAAGGFLARAACPRISSWRRRLYHSVDLALPNSNAEAEQLVRHFGLPYERIHVVPTAPQSDSRMPIPSPSPSWSATSDSCSVPDGSSHARINSVFSRPCGGRTSLS